MQATYILPIRRNRLHPRDDLTDYVRWLSHHLEVVIVDGSPSDIFTAHAEAWGPGVRHMALDPDLSTPNGKVGGVMTGLRAASHDRVVIADDDVRYDLPALRRIVDLLQVHAAVRPQNYFRPLPWHAQLDTARTLLNRMFGGDWPGTLGVRAEFIRAAGGYDGSVLFENLELIRTIGAVGGDEIVPLDLYVQRRPPDASHFFSQRLRQAYDEWARPARMLVFLAILPLSAILMRRHRPALAACGLAAVGLAEAGRRRAAGASVFPARCSLLAPIWLLERAICIWLALGARLLLGGVPYHGSLLTRAATPARTLWRRHRAAGHGLRAVAA